MGSYKDRQWYKNIKTAFCIIFSFALCAYCAFGGMRYDYHRFIVMRIVGWIGMIFFGVCGAFALYRYIKLRNQGRRVVEITDEGLLISGTLIEWKNITGFGLNGYDGIFIYTDNCEEEIARAGWLKKMIMRMSYGLSGSIYGFSLISLDYGYDEFVEKCRPYLEQVGTHLTTYDNSQREYEN